MGVRHSARLKHLLPLGPPPPPAMDAIRKKMQSLKSETDGLYAVINGFEEETKESNRRSDQADVDIRDFGKKVHSLEIDFDETCDKLQKATESLEEKDKMYREVESDVCSLSRRIMLMEEEPRSLRRTLPAPSPSLLSPPRRLTTSSRRS